MKNPSLRVEPLTPHIIRILLIALTISSSLFVTSVQAIELVRGVRARTVHETTSNETPGNSTQSVTTYLKGYSYNRRNELRFGGQLDFSRSDTAGSELNPKLFIGNLANIIDNTLVLDTELSLYRRDILDSVIAAPEFDNNQNGVETLSYRVTPTYSFNLGSNTRADMLYSFQESRELDSVTDNQTTSHSVEGAWIKPSLSNQFSWVTATGYKTTEFSSNDRVEQANATLTLGFYPRRRWFIGGLIGQDWEDLSTVPGGYRSSNRWNLYTKWTPTQRISTSASFGQTDITGYTSQLEVGFEGQRWDVNLRWSRSSSYTSFALDPFALLTEQNPASTIDQEQDIPAPEILDQSPLTVFEQQSVDEEASIAFRLSGRRSQISTDLSYLSRTDPAPDADVAIISARAGFYRDIITNWTVGIQHETRHVRPAAAISANYYINTTELSVNVKF